MNFANKVLVFYLGICKWLGGNLFIIMMIFHPIILSSQAEYISVDTIKNKYQNPILHLDYSDPDVIRVGEKYYMTASSFSHFPGLPILESQDLVNWTIIGHAALEYPDKTFVLPQHGNAIWAPSIRHHKGEFYIYYGDPDRGVYMTKASKPEGPWSPLKLIKKVTGWIDTCPLWDEDGKAYIVHAYANSRVGIKSILAINEMSPNGEEILGTSTLVFNGQKDHNTIEGPKLYKRNGYYYIFAPAGGVATGWQTVLRSKNIYGPYEDNVVLEQGSTVINGPHQGGWVTAPDGSDWFLHFQDKGAYGRIVHLQPMSWKDDWPVMGIDFDKNGIGEPVSSYNFTHNESAKTTILPQTSDEFNNSELGLQWQWQANPNKTWYTLNPNKGNIRLHGVGVKKEPNLWMTPNLLMQKFPAENFIAQSKINLSTIKVNSTLGLIVFGLDYAYVGIQKNNTGKYEIKVNQCLNADKGTKEEGKSSIIIVKSSEIHLGVKVESSYANGAQVPSAICQFMYSLDGQKYIEIGEKFIAREGKWVGAKTGLFYEAPLNTYADVDWFRVK